MTEFSIYQINVDRDTANVCFIGMESLEKIKGTKDVNAAAYDRVYDGKMDCISLENIYQKFNVDHPADYKGRSLSVSDVVEIRESDTLNPGFYFVDSIGFKSISFDKSLWMSFFTNTLSISFPACMASMTALTPNIISFFSIILSYLAVWVIVQSQKSPGIVQGCFGHGTSA